MADYWFENDHGDAMIHDQEVLSKVGSEIHNITESTSPGDSVNYSEFVWNYDDMGVSGGTEHRTWTAEQMAAANLDKLKLDAKSYAGPNYHYVYNAPVDGTIRVWNPNNYNIQLFINGLAVSTLRQAQSQADAHAFKLQAGDVVRAYSNDFTSRDQVQVLFLPSTYPLTSYPSLNPVQQVVHIDFDTREGSLLTDLSGNGADAQSMHSSTSVSLPQIVTGVGGGQAMEFLNYQYAYIPQSQYHDKYQIHDYEPWSCSAWINLYGEGTSWQTIFNKGSGERVSFFVAGQTLHLFMIQSWSGSYLGKWTNSQVINYNTTYHVGVTYDGSKTDDGLSLYLNGTKLTNVISNNSLGGNTCDNQYDLCIGNNLHHPDTSAINGWIDNFRLFNRELSESEMAYIYSNLI